MHAIREGKKGLCIFMLCPVDQLSCIKNFLVYLLLVLYWAPVNKRMGLLLVDMVTYMISIFLTITKQINNLINFDAMSRLFISHQPHLPERICMADGMLPEEVD